MGGCQCSKEEDINKVLKENEATNVGPKKKQRLVTHSRIEHKMKENSGEALILDYDAEGEEIPSTPERLPNTRRHRQGQELPNSANRRKPPRKRRSKSINLVKQQNSPRLEDDLAKHSDVYIISQKKYQEEYVRVKISQKGKKGTLAIIKDSESHDEEAEFTFNPEGMDGRLVSKELKNESGKQKGQYSGRKGSGFGQSKFKNSGRDGKKARSNISEKNHIGVREAHELHKSKKKPIFESFEVSSVLSRGKDEGQSEASESHLGVDLSKMSGFNAIKSMKSHRAKSEKGRIRKDEKSSKKKSKKHGRVRKSQILPVNLMAFNKVKPKEIEIEGSPFKVAKCELDMEVIHYTLRQKLTPSGMIVRSTNFSKKFSTFFTEMKSIFYELLKTRKKVSFKLFLGYFLLSSQNLFFQISNFFLKIFSQRDMLCGRVRGLRLLRQQPAR